MDKRDSIEKRWTESAENVLLGKKIVKVQYMTAYECDDMMWNNRPIAFKLNDGTWVIAQSDDEGNDGGVLTYSHKDDNKYDDNVIPVI